MADLQKNDVEIDAFGRQITSNLRSELDIASHADFSPERIRLLKNGSRQFVQYGDTSNFTDAPDTWDLEPAGGDTMVLESAESGTYVVGSDMATSFAFSINQSLQGNDSIRVGAYNGSDGWYIEHRGDHADDSTVDLIVERNGSRTVLASNVELTRPVTGFQRYEIRYNWYNVGEQEWIQTFIDNNRALDEIKQVNEVIAHTGQEGVKGPETANMNVYYEVNADASTTGLVFEAGSMALNVKSSMSQLIRQKPNHVEVTVPATNDVWHPVYAIRTETGTTINADLQDLQILDYGNDAEVSLLATSVSPTKTDATGFGVPAYHHAQNSIIEDTTNISTGPDDAGVETDPSSTGFKPGGVTLASADLHPSGKDFKTGAVSAGQTTAQRQVLTSDIVIFWAKSSNAGGDLHFNFVTNQEY